MKAFSLEEYLKNHSRKVVTRGGRTVKRILCTNARGDYPVVALVDCGSYDSALSYTKDGGFYTSGETSVNDLFFAPEKHEGWINLYKDTAGIYVPSQIYKTKESAEASSCMTCIATVKIEWEE